MEWNGKRGRKEGGDVFPLDLLMLQQYDVRR
jgi:hypothetical protein